MVWVQYAKIYTQDFRVQAGRPPLLLRFPQSREGWCAFCGGGAVWQACVIDHGYRAARAGEPAGGRAWVWFGEAGREVGGDAGGKGRVGTAESIYKPVGHDAR